MKQDPDGDPDLEHDARRNGDFEPRPENDAILRVWLERLPQPWAGAYTEIRRLDPNGARVSDASFLRTIAPPYLLRHYDRLDREKEALGYVELADLRGRPMHRLARFPHVLRYAEAIGAPHPDGDLLKCHACRLSLAVDYDAKSDVFTLREVVPEWDDPS